MRVAMMTMCAENTTTTKRWVPFGPLDEFDVANTTSLVTWVLAMRGGRGGASVGRVGGALRTLLIVELGSRSFFRRRDVHACTHNIFVKKYGMTTM